MLKAIKGNKVYKIEETEKKKYLAQGYDIHDEEGKIIEHSTKSTVPYAKYSELEALNKKLEAELEKLKKNNPPDDGEAFQEDEKTAKEKKKVG